MAPSKGEHPDHSPGVTQAEFSIFCWLRTHPDVALTYGIKQCNGKTTIGSMLQQLLHAQGADVAWHDELPESTASLRGNEKAAAFISSFSRRPGRRLKNLRDRLEELAAKDAVAPTRLAAVLRNGKASLIDFPLLRERVRARRVKKSTRCYNKMVACTEVAMVERRRVIDFVERKLRCRCGAFLHFDRARSQQVGVCAAWQFQCQKSCNIPPLHTSAQVHGDDYELNAKLNYAISTCALSFARMVPFLFFLGSVLVRRETCDA
jgi:hypothetical protein